MGVVSVEASTASVPEVGPGASPRAALQKLRVRPISTIIAAAILGVHHYLHSMPGGTHLLFGVFLRDLLVGAITLGVGPMNAPSLVKGAKANDCLVLTRLWLADELPRNSESRVIGIVIRSLRQHTSLKFLLSYADPSQGHLGTIYQASNWLYTGLSEAMPLYDLGDGVARHSRSLSHAFGTHSVRYFAAKGIDVRLIPQSPKHRYLYFIDPTWRSRLRVPVSPYPKRETTDACS